MKGGSDVASTIGNPAVAESITNVVTSARVMDAQTASNVTGGLSWTALLSSLFCGAISFGLCKVRFHIITMVRELDPDNVLHLNTLLTLFEEGSWLILLPLLLIFPALALIMMAGFALFGWVLSRPLKKIAEKRRQYWDEMGKDLMVKIVRKRSITIFILGVFLSAIPVLGYLVTIILLNLYVFSVIALYEKSTSRIVAKIIMRFLKLTLFLFACVFAGIPFLGILLLVPYIISYMLRMRAIKRQ